MPQGESPNMRSLRRAVAVALSLPLPGCFDDAGGGAGAKVFLALGISLAAVFLIFYIVVKGRERE